MNTSSTPVTRLLRLVKEERSDVITIYFYAAFSGLIQLSLPVGIQAIIGFVLAGTLSASLVVLIGFIVLGVLLVGLLQIAQMRTVEKIQQKIFVRYAYAFADRIPRLDLRQIDTFYLPELVNRFFDTVSLQKSISKLLLDVPIATIQILFGLILLSFYHPAFILFGVILLLLLWGILHLTGQRGLQTSLEESRHKYAVAGWLEEMGRLVRAFKFAIPSGIHLQKTDERTVRYLNARTDHFSILLVQYRTLVAFKVLITLSMLIVGVMLLLDQQINIGQFVAAEIIIITVTNAIEKIIINLDKVYDVLTSVEKINKLLEKPVEASGSLNRISTGAISVKASALSFGYDERALIRDLDLHIPANAKVAIAGSEGSGKSTLLKVLATIYRPTTGGLLYNDIPVANYDTDKLRERMGLFLQQENVFQGSLLDDLTMGRAYDEEYLQSLAERTGLMNAVRELPQGYDTELDPTGKRLSSNMVHKIQFVRCLLNRPSLLIMEDPFKNIEDPYRQQLIDLVFELKDTTVIMATNDADVLRRVDNVIVLNK